MGKAKPAPSRAELEAEARSAWAEVAPARPLDRARVVFPYYTPTSYAAEYGISESNARTHLSELCEGKAGKPAKFTRGRYRFAGQRQPEFVYWPVGVSAPDDGTLPTE